MPADLDHLWGWQREFDGRLGQVELVQELGLEERDLDDLIPLVQALSRECRDALDFSRTFPERYPAVFILLLVLTGIYRFQDGNFWDRIREIFPELNDNHLQGWREAWPKALRRYGLSTFAHVPTAHRTLMPIQLHGGIARDHLEPFFKALVWPAVTHPQWAGATARDLMDDLPRRMSLRSSLPRAVLRFLEHGGHLAERFLDRCLERCERTLDRISSEGETGQPDPADTSRLPAHVVEVLERLARGETTDSRGRRSNLTRYHRPRLQFEPGGAGILLELPAQRLASRAIQRVAWHVVLGGRTLVVPVDRVPEAEGLSTGFARLPVPDACDGLAVHLMVDGSTVRHWDLTGLQEDVLFFEASTGMALERNLLPAGDTWVIGPVGSRFTVQTPGNETGVEPLCQGILRPGEIGWPGYEAHLLALEGPALLTIERGQAGPLTRPIEEPSSTRSTAAPSEDATAGHDGVRWALIGMTGASPCIAFGTETLKLSLPAIAASHQACLLVERGASVSTEAPPVLQLKDRHGRLLQRLEARGLPPGIPGAGRRYRIPLAPFRGTLESSCESHLLLELLVPSSRQDDATYPVLSLQQAWEPTVQAADWQDGRLRLQWEERHHIEDRHLWIWDLWRPWQEPVGFSLEGSARGQAELAWPDELPPGTYRGWLGVLDWTSSVEPERPERGVRGSFDVEVGTPEARQEHLDRLGEGPLERAELFMASGYEGRTSFPQLYFLECRVDARHVWPMVLTAMGTIEAPEAAQKAWFEKVGYVACDIRAWDTARQLVDWTAVVSAERRQEALAALIRLGWLRRVSPTWKPVEFKNVEREICEVDCPPLGDATIRRLWDLWPPLGSGVEPLGSEADPDGRDRLLRALGPEAQQALEQAQSAPGPSQALAHFAGSAQDPDQVAHMLAGGAAMLDLLLPDAEEDLRPLDDRVLPASMKRVLQTVLNDPDSGRNLETRVTLHAPQMARQLARLSTGNGAPGALARAFKGREPRLFRHQKPGQALAGLPVICGAVALLCRLKASGDSDANLPPPLELDELASWMFASVPALFAHDLVLVDRVLATPDPAHVGGVHAPVA